MHHFQEGDTALSDVTTPVINFLTRGNEAALEVIPIKDIGLWRACCENGFDFMSDGVAERDQRSAPKRKENRPTITEESDLI